MSFKVGDRVRCIKKDIFLNVGEVSVGEIYTVAASNIGDSDFCIRVEEVKGAYWRCCFEFAGPEEIKVGDVYFLEHLGVFKVYDTSTPNIGIRVQLENGTLIYVSPELLTGKTPTDHRDRVPSVEPMAGAFFNKIRYNQIWNGKEWEWNVARIPPAVTKIIHNGTTTITFFSDGKKVITRPSPDDVEKYDPFIGWCVGVVEHLYGGKEKAKKFYKKHAVVQKEAK